MINWKESSFNKNSFTKNSIDYFNEEIENRIEQDEVQICSTYNPLCPSPKSEERQKMMERDLSNAIYFDSNASYPISKRVKEAILKIYDMYGNGSSLHYAGQQIRSYVEQSRENISKYLGFDSKNLIFTSSGSESNNMFLKGVCFKRLGNGRKRIIISSFEHKSIIKTAKYLEKFGYNINMIDTDKKGLINYTEFEKLLGNDVLLISVMGANNLLGTIQPINELVSITKKYDNNILFHSDCSQLLGRVSKESLKFDNIDSLTFSGHKFGGTIGCSVLYLKDFDFIEPLIHGGEQEFSLRAGSYNVASIFAFNLAVLFLEEETIKDVLKLRNYFEEKLLQNFNCRINCKDSPRINNTISVTFFDMVDIVEKLNEYNIFVSSTSACDSNDKKVSHVLKQLGMNEEEAKRTIRISINEFATVEKINRFINVLERINNVSK